MPDGPTPPKGQFLLRNVHDHIVHRYAAGGGVVNHTGRFGLIRAEVVQTQRTIMCVNVINGICTSV